MIQAKLSAELRNDFLLNAYSNSNCQRSHKESSSFVETMQYPRDLTTPHYRPELDAHITLKSALALSTEAPAP
jgi:hypothetical protein